MGSAGALARRVETKSHVDPADGTVLTTPQATWHIYSGLAPIEEYDVTGSGTGAAATLAREFVWGDRFPEPVAMIDHTSAGDQAGGAEVVHSLLDILGSVVALTNSAGDVSEWVYDPATGLLTAKKDAANESVNYNYWSTGQLKTRTWARLHMGSALVTTYNYDADTGQLTSVDYSDTGAGADVTYTYERNGAPKTVTDADASGTDHVFDYSKWPVETTETISGLYDIALTRTFDAFARGRPTEVDFEFDSASVHDVDYVYDPATGRLERITGPGLPAYGAVYGYLEDGSSNPVADLVAQLDFRSAASTTIARQTTAYEANWDKVDQVTSTWDPDGTPRTIAQYGTIGYDELGRRTSVDGSGEASPGDFGYGYDLRSQLDSVTGTSAVLGSVSWGYSYESIGNRLMEQYNGGPQVAYTTNNLNQYTDAGPHGDPTYDLDGNLVAFDFAGATDMTYTWDAKNRLIAATPASPGEGDRKVEYGYDYRGRKILRKEFVYASGAWGAPSIEKYVYDGWNRVLEIKPVASVDTVTRKYTWGLDLAGSLTDAGGVGGLLAIADTKGTSSTSDDETYLVFSDPSGNVAQLMASHSGGSYGTVAAAYEYDAYGNELPTVVTATYEQPFRFSTKPFDEVTGLGYWGYRHYDPRTGRWWSRDPIGVIEEANLYNYVANEPIGGLDALGLTKQVDDFGPVDALDWWRSGYGEDIEILGDDFRQWFRGIPAVAAFVSNIYPTIEVMLKRNCQSGASSISFDRTNSSINTSGNGSRWAAFGNIRIHAQVRCTMHQLQSMACCCKAQCRIQLNASDTYHSFRNAPLVARGAWWTFHFVTQTPIRRIKNGRLPWPWVYGPTPYKISWIDTIEQDFRVCSNGDIVRGRAWYPLDGS